MKIQHYVCALFIFAGSAMLECMQNEEQGEAFSIALNSEQKKILEALTPQQQEVVGIIIQQTMQATLQSSLFGEKRLLKMFALCKEFGDDCPTIKEYVQALFKDTEEMLKKIQHQQANMQKRLPSKNNFSQPVSSMPSSSDALIKARIQAREKKENAAKTSSS